ncbi:uncharacterized protein K441DRAFT_667643 [Cenococcum geophilum 1.58]|uniref:uncharacterized protein n=1 Tax=Cenococcum geophilum 1.58 TaxID=794803 RepID=UPI00358F3369|nr:hypothetical protein K441DRAFT_667643 [Cenococcum geophilum 1.58]
MQQPHPTPPLLISSYLKRHLFFLFNPIQSASAPGVSGNRVEEEIEYLKAVSWSNIIWLSEGG